MSETTTTTTTAEDVAAVIEAAAATTLVGSLSEAWLVGMQRAASSHEQGPGEGAAVLVDVLWTRLLGDVRRAGVSVAAQLEQLAATEETITDDHRRYYVQRLREALELKLSSYVTSRKLAETLRFPLDAPPLKLDSSGPRRSIELQQPQPSWCELCGERHDEEHGDAVIVREHYRRSGAELIDCMLDDARELLNQLEKGPARREALGALWQAEELHAATEPEEYDTDSELGSELVRETIEAIDGALWAGGFIPVWDAGDYYVVPAIDS